MAPADDQLVGACDEGEPSVVVALPDVTGPEPAVVGEGLGCGPEMDPVAVDHVGATNLHLVVGIEAELDTG